MEDLKQENERVKKELDVALREENRWKSNFNNYRDVCRKQYQILQEIKAIVCGNYEIIDPQGRKDILKLITKAESEGNNV